MKPIVGYTPGVWDLFHIGHLNLLRRARAQCDWLIVGAVTDDAVLRIKNQMPASPLAERMAVVAGLTIVDEVVIDDSLDKVEMWARLHFDVVFKGDDWCGTAKGRALEVGMASVGARVVYFPYTVEVSSSALRAQLVAPNPDQGVPADR